MKKIEIRKLSINKFESMEKQWNKCLQDSGSNPLFLDWFWQLTWWKIWQGRLNLSLLLLGVFEDNKLIGIAPMYSYSYKRFRLFSVKTCEIIGDHTRSNDSIRSEYLNFIFPKKRYAEILPYLFEFLKNEGVEEVCLKDVPESSETIKYLINKFSLFQKKIDTGIKLAVQGDFSQYVLSLGKSTRLKLFNRRKLLSSSEVKSCKSEFDLIYFFDALNALHISRWGQKCFSDHSLDFHKKVALYYLNKGELSATLLRVDAKVVAVSYDISREKTRYNIQLGFDEFINNKVSFGTLMLGYSIEEAFNNSCLNHYDFLAGCGKNTFYKEKFKGNRESFFTMTIPLTIKSKVLFILISNLKKAKKSILLRSTWQNAKIFP
jgi:hypothetical protein